MFVTHDIDEAIKLGDNIAVFRTGGKLAQFDTPERLLAHPADDFVADFVGQDRGIRRLSFVKAADLPLREGLVLPADSPVARARAADEPWVLVVDGDRRPLGWAAVADLPAGGTLADAALTPLGHTFSLAGDSARAALDAALLSPSRLAVGVDPQGAVVGVADAYELSAAMTGDGTAAEAAVEEKTVGDAAVTPEKARAATTEAESGETAATGAGTADAAAAGDSVSKVSVAKDETDGGGEADGAGSGSGGDGR